MAQLRDIKQRIDSVQKIKKMTQAMKMVAASKFKRASSKVSQSTSYLSELESIIAVLSSQAEGDLESPLFEENQSSKTLIILLTGDRGLCGGFNTNIIKFANKIASECKGEKEYIIFGKKGYQYFKNRGAVIRDYKERFFENLSIESIQVVINSVIDVYQTGEFGRVVLLYNKYFSAILNKPTEKQLLPLKFDATASESSDLILEPSISDVLNTVSTQFLELTLYRACLESSAAEQGARMASMDSATNNAGEMTKELTLEYNRRRQAQITTELSEIVAGAEALVS